jgi:CRP-like cAMP-binding protein
MCASVLSNKVIQNAQTTASVQNSVNNSRERHPGASNDASASDDISSGFSEFRQFLHPDAVARKIWGLVLLFVVIYNTFMIPLRIALDIANDWLYVIDYVLDLLLLLNLYCTYQVFYTIQGGLLITSKTAIKRIFWEHNFSWSFIACIPFDILTLCVVGQSRQYVVWTMQLLRVPKLFILLDAGKFLNCLEDVLDRLKISYVASQVINLLLLVCMIGHWAACGFYMLPYWINLNEAESCVNEPGALYGTACEFEGTWVQMQIMTGKLPQDGGDQWTRFLRAVNWAIPTLTLEVLDDVFAINSQEMMYCLIAMLFGIIINATIIGTIISLVTASDSVSADTHIVRELLESRNVPKQLRDRVIGHLMFMDSTYGKLIQNESELVQELPYSLQVAIIENTKLPFLMKCPLYDYCSLQIKRNLCMAMTQHIFSDGDIIIKSGDIGNEMFFVADGAVEVCNDAGTVFTTIGAGSFFGESGLVFSDRRTANVRASGFCVCYCLRREDLNNELKFSADFDASSAVSSLKKLVAGNAKRNMAVSRNLRLSREISHKLSRMISDLDGEKREPALVRALRDPFSTLRCVWDSISLGILFYFFFSIPFHLAFLHSGTLIDYEPYLVIDFLCDVFWVVDMFFKSRYFPVLLLSGKYDVDQAHVWKSYYSGRFLYDLVASFPLEIFALAGATDEERRICLHAYRLIHLLRIPMLFSQINVVLKHLERSDIR